MVNTAPAASDLLAAAVADDTIAVGAYVAPVRLDPGGHPEPGNLRERIRHTGPTIAWPIPRETDMYTYDQFDRTLVAERVAELRDQVDRRLSGALSEEEFRPLRLMNGLYLQLHAYMLRIAIPYGALVLGAVAQARRGRRGATTAAMAISPRGRISSSTGSSWRTAPDLMADLASVEPARACRPAATACATSRPTIGPASPPTRSRIRASGPRLLRQ